MSSIRPGSISIALLGLLSAAFLVYCGLDEHYTGMGESALPGDPLRPNTPTIVVDCGTCPACDTPGDAGGDADHGEMGVSDLTGTGYRFDSLVLTAPLTGFLGDNINTYFAEQIDENLLNVLLLVSGDDRSTGELTFDVGPGEPDGNAYRFGDERSELGCDLTGRDFETVEPASLTFPNDLLTPPALPITFLRLSGTFASDGTAIAQGVLEGALTEEDALQITIMGSDFVTFFENMDIPMDLDTDEDGTEDAWKFVGSFTAVQVELAGE